MGDFMEKDLIEKYKNEMLKMYNSVKKEVPVINREEPTAIPVVAEETPQTDGTGNLLGVVTSFDKLYPVNNAKVTIFTGEFENMNIIDTDFTDQNGKTKIFVLPTPEKQLSLESGSTTQPYALYNMLVSSEGYLDNMHLNIPVFSGVTSVQSSNLMLRETAGSENINIYDESQKYNL